MIDSEFSFEREDMERLENLDPGMLADSVPTQAGDSGKAATDPTASGEAGPADPGAGNTGATTPDGTEVSPSDLGGDETLTPAPDGEVVFDLGAIEVPVGAGFNYEFGLFF